MVGTTCSYDDLLDLCRHEHRRIVLGSLAVEPRTASLEELAEEIVTHVRSDTAEPERATGRVRTTLHHDHLPRLAAAGIVEYDHATKRVGPTAAFDEVRPQLTSVLAADPALGTLLSA